MCPVHRQRRLPGACRLQTIAVVRTLLAVISSRWHCRWSVSLYLRRWLDWECTASVRSVNDRGTHSGPLAQSARGRVRGADARRAPNGSRIAQERHRRLDRRGTAKSWRRNDPQNGQVVFHFTPTSASSMNQIEIFNGILTRKVIRHGSLDSTKLLTQTIEAFITTWNSDCEPINWTATADEIIDKVGPSPPILIN